jgi:hypothetical protein
MAVPVSREVSRVFGRDDLADAVKFCYERPPDFVSDYMLENFDLEQIAPSLQDNAMGEDKGSGPEIVPAFGRDIIVRGQGSDGSVSSSPNVEDAEIEGRPSPVPTGGVESGPSASHATREAGSTKRGQDLIGLLAAEWGYSQDDGDCYLRGDGWRIRKVADSLFSWALVSPSGDVVCRYWLRNHCLAEGPLEIDHDVWSYSMENPELCSLVLADQDGTPRAYAGTELRQMRDSCVLAVYPAKDRLVLRKD